MKEPVIRNLISPPAAQTPDSIALVWDKPEYFEALLGYRIFVDGKLTGFAESTDFTLLNLKSDTEYVIEAAAVSRSGDIFPRSTPIVVKTEPASERLDITAFGAAGGGTTLNTAAIQRAIDACPHGGTVYVPPGTFVTGALFLKSHMTLFVEEGGMLLGSGELDDYPVFVYRWEGRMRPCHASLINTPMDDSVRPENITIAGKGVIDANGIILAQKAEAAGKASRGRCVCLRNCDDVYLKDITLRQSPGWCLHLIFCRRVSINGIQVHSKYDAFGNLYGIVNGDGIDPDSTSDLYIFHSTIASGDDCIAIKSGRDAEGRAAGVPSERIRITNCLFKSGFGVAVGSEMSGGVRDVFVQDCRFENTYSVASIKAPRGRGAVIENIRFESCTHFNRDLHYRDCRWFRGALYVDQFYSHETFDAETVEAVAETTPVIRNLSFENITLDTVAGNAIYLTGLPERPLENITMTNILARGKYGLKAVNVDGLTLTRVTVHSFEDEPCRLQNVVYFPKA